MTSAHERQFYAMYNQHGQLNEAVPETKARGYESFANIAKMEDGSWEAAFKKLDDANGYYNEIQSNSPGFNAQVPHQNRSQQFGVHVWPNSSGT